ncbi:MAG: helix-turn-helix domain-containing protein [Gammaproteobacteria bacterium]
MSFGHALRTFREERGFSLREFGKLCGIDHAYIHRLEKDEKTDPSPDTIDSFVRTLKLTPRKARMLRFLVGRTGLNDLIDVFLEDGERSLDSFETTAQTSFRGKRPSNKEEWRRAADRIEEMLKDL